MRTSLCRQEVSGSSPAKPAPAQRPKLTAQAACSVTSREVDHADVGQSVEHELHPERGQQKRNTFSVTSIRLASSLLLTCTAQRKTITSSARTATSTPTATASTAIELPPVPF
jgi:hypothetical protein